MHYLHLTLTYLSVLFLHMHSTDEGLHSSDVHLSKVITTAYLHIHGSAHKYTMYTGNHRNHTTLAGGQV